MMAREPDLVPVEERPAVLLIGGVDPSGGAGLTLDAAVVRESGLHPLVVVTGVAVQNTTRLASRHDLPPAQVVEQLQVLAEEFRLGAVKIGMLGRVETVEQVAGWLAERPRLPVVLDPVMSTSSGGTLGETGLDRALVRHLVPRARVITPNVWEAGMLTGFEIASRDDVPTAARALRDMGASWVLVKGGHLRGAVADDYLSGPDEEAWLQGEWVDTRDVRGTGCSLASVLACGLARGESVPDASRIAKRFVRRGLASAYVVGRGRFLGGRPEN
jgi:hydroxymethylpyrimidine/phosphomethylpyrimidine kinase